MGCYINPKTVSKERWLGENAIMTLGPTPITSEILPVCLVDNGDFTAAAIGFSQREVDVFNDPSDPRPKIWFSVLRTDLYTVSDLKNYERT